MKKKFLSMVTALVMLISLLPQGILTVSAATITAIQPTGGDGTADNPYQIGTAAELYWFAGLVNGTLEGVTQNLSANAVLTANIDLSGTGNWTPIGNAANIYRGTFDGQSHTVKDMSITKQGDNSGLFGYTDGATIKNIIITGEITITAESYTEGYGSIVGRADNNTTVTNCHSSVNITIDSTMESTAENCIGHIGGIIGKMHDANSPISNCSYSGTIELKDKPINVAAGIVGYAIYSSVPITNCSFTGKINSNNTGATIIGGIFGYTRSSGDVKVTNCLSVGTITKSKDTSVTGILIGQINMGYGNNAVKNNYCISSSINVIGSTTGAPTTAPATLCTETQLTSGEVAYLLQSGQKADENGNTPEVWGQKIGTDNYPVQGGAKVYRVVAYAGCKGNPGNEGTAYSNTNAPVYGDHSFDSNGFGVCGDCLYQPAEWDETNNRYEISNAGQLYWFAGLVNGTLSGVTQNTSANAILTDNITVNTGVLTDEGYVNSSNMDNFTSWTPIGNSSKQYTGTFDGQGYTVSGLYVNDTNAYYVGLFGYVGSGGRVSNVGVVDSYFRGYDYIGGVCGANYGTIENCYNAGFLTSPTYPYIGGVCGANYDTIKNCYNIGIVLISGVCGYNGGTIENCYNAGTVLKRGSAYGVCGDNRNTIKNCYYLDTTGTDSYATPKTAEEFASGEVAYLLQGKQTKNVWGQEIDTDNYPVPGGAKVYQVVAYAGCKGNPGNESTVYSNTDAPVYGDHSFDSNGFCEYGDSGYQPAEWDETNNRYEIGNAGQLYWFAGLVNGTLSGVTQNTSANAILTDNIVVNTGVLKADGTLADDTSGFTSWTPIGDSYDNYTGTFDGNGKTISGLYFNDTNAYNVGLFGYVGSNETNKGSVSNVGVVDSYFGGHMDVGGVCGTAGDNSTITNCYNTGTVRGTIYGGGVCGTAGANSTIENCYNTGKVSGKSNVGGVCGSAGGNSTIKNCYNKGLVDGNDNGGGVCGENYGTIEVCYNTGSVIGIGKTGGVCGTAGANSTIANCYNAGSIASSLYAGGVCGTAGANSTITNCYNAGSVAASGNSASAGGVCGRNSNGNITNCYFDSEKYRGNAVANDENGTVTNVEGKTTDKFTSGEVAYLLQGKQTENVWGQEIDTDNYPVLTSDIAKKVLKVEFKTLGADGEYTLYAERYGNYGKVLSDFPGEIRDTIWVDGVKQFTASSAVIEDKTVYPVGYSVKYDDGGKVVISAPKMGNYTIIIASYSVESLLNVQSADITLESWVDLYEIIDLNGFDTTGADTVKVFFWDTEMRPQCDAAVKTLP